MSTDTALVIIDTQIGVIEPAYHGTEVLAAISTLLKQARAAATPVIYVQHDGPGLEFGTAAWQIHPDIAPKDGEPVVHKRASDSFYETTLQQELEKRGIKQLVVVGGETGYCIDTTVRRATTYGYNVTLVGDAHAASDHHTLQAQQIIAYHNEVLDGFRTDQYIIRVKPTAEITF